MKSPGLIDPEAILYRYYDKGSPLAVYEPGSWGPLEANALLAKDGRHWMHEEAGHMLET